jgi:N-acylglucosamine-6-phosphate 2-epimerase
VLVTPATLGRLNGGLIVSCQAPAGHPLRTPSTIARLARAVALGGAVGLRVNSVPDLRAVKAVTDLPVIGIHKVARRNGRDLITPRLSLAAGLAAAGADIVAVEATAEAYPDPGDPAILISRIRSELGVPVMADVATVTEGIRAWEAGADLVATTLSGYTTAHPSGAPGPGPDDGPDLDLVAALHGCGILTVAEGRYGTPEQMDLAFRNGAFAVVVGTAITDPAAITRRFARLTPATLRADGGPR